MVIGVMWMYHDPLKIMPLEKTFVRIVIRQAMQPGTECGPQRLLPSAICVIPMASEGLMGMCAWGME